MTKKIGNNQPNAEQQSTSQAPTQDAGFQQAAPGVQTHVGVGVGSLYDNMVSLTNPLSETTVKLNQGIQDQLDANSYFKNWKLVPFSIAEGTNMECALVITLAGEYAIVHPILYVENETFSHNVQEAQGFQEAKLEQTTYGQVVRETNFKQIVADEMQKVGITVDSTKLYIGGCSVVNPKTVDVGDDFSARLLTNAIRENAATLHTHLNSRPTDASLKFAALAADNNGQKNINVKLLTAASKFDGLNAPVFAPAVISSTVQVKNRMINGTTEQSLGEIAGYIDVTPIVEFERIQQANINQQNGVAGKPVPFFRSSYVITDINSGGSATLPPENQMALLDSLPELVNQHAYFDTLLDSKKRTEINELYDIASVGYSLADAGNKAFPQIHSVKFQEGKLNWLNTMFHDSISVFLDVPVSGAGTVLKAMIKSPVVSNRIISQLLGIDDAGLSQDACISLGRIPMGYYEYQGKRRDIRELFNNISWTNYAKGDAATQQRWLNAMVNVGFWMDADGSDHKLYNERLAMMNTITNGSFVMTGVCERVELSPAKFVALKNGRAANGINLVVQNQNAPVHEEIQGMTNAFAQGVGGQTANVSQAAPNVNAGGFGFNTQL